MDFQRAARRAPLAAHRSSGRAATVACPPLGSASLAKTAAKEREGGRPAGEKEGRAGCRNARRDVHSGKLPDGARAEPSSRVDRERGDVEVRRKREGQRQRGERGIAGQLEGRESIMSVERTSSRHRVAIELNPAEVG